MAIRHAVVAAVALALGPGALSAPPDLGEKLIEERLRPLEALPRERPVDRPWPLPGATAVEHPRVPLEVIRTPVIPAEVTLKPDPLRPHPLPEGAPLVGERLDQRLPGVVALPSKPPLRLPGPALEEVPPVPILAERPPERAPAGEPTRDASRAAVTAAPPPARDGPLPFERLSLPDPYPLRQEIELAHPPEEVLPLPLAPVAAPLVLPQTEG